MFSFQLLLAFPEQIDSMKADLTKYLPNIKSSHRVEALARALGFKTYAALRAADFFWGGSTLVDVNWSAFNDYLKDKGFSAAAKPLYLAAGRASIRLTLGMKDLDYQSLTSEGFGINTSHHNGETPQSRAERFRTAREEMLSDTCVEEMLRSYSLISGIPHTRTITKKHGAYYLKHIAENVSFTYPDGEVSPPKYVGTGSMIFAALSAGFWFKPVGGGSQSVHFNMQQSAIEDLDCKVRPDGSLSRARKSVPAKNKFDGVTGNKCYEYIFDTFEPEGVERDFGLELRCLGHSNGLYYYLSYARKSIIALTANAHTLKNLTKLDNIEAWKASPIWLNGKASKRVPLSTVSELMSISSRRGFFWPETEIKGSGRWVTG